MQLETTNGHELTQGGKPQPKLLTTDFTDEHGFFNKKMGTKR